MAGLTGTAGRAYPATANRDLPPCRCRLPVGIRIIGFRVIFIRDPDVFPYDRRALVSGLVIEYVVGLSGKIASASGTGLQYFLWHIFLRGF